MTAVRYDRLRVAIMACWFVLSITPFARTTWAADPTTLEDVRSRFGHPVMWVPRPAQPPDVDGRLDDAIWKSAEAVVLRSATGGWTAPSQRTEARVLADDRAIYFGVRCYEAEPDRIIAAPLEKMGIVNTGDTVQLFLDPGHREEPGEYFHVAVNPKGTVYTARGCGAFDPRARYTVEGKLAEKAAPKKWSPDVSTKTAMFEKGWTVEVAIPLADLGCQSGRIPRVWGLNINRQRPELGVVMPQIRQGTTRYTPQVRPLDEPDKYRDGEYSGWAPTYSAYSYRDSQPFHHPHRFGHAVLEVGNVEVEHPPEVFEVIYRSDFDSGKVEPFENGRLRDESFRGPGKSYASQPKGKQTLYFKQPLDDLDDAMLIMTFRMPNNGRLYHYARMPDGWKCGACRHEFFITKEAAASRKVDHAGFALFPTFDLYDMHADKAAWKPWGRLWQGPGPWKMVTGYLSEPSESAVSYPGTDWAILRMRLGEFRRYAGRSSKWPDMPGQILAPRELDYPNGLAFFPAPGPLLISDLVIFRGQDVEPPLPVDRIRHEVVDDRLVVRWARSKDNTLTAFYRIYAGDQLLAETHGLQVSLPVDHVGDRSIEVRAVDLFDNVSASAD